jgi:hypothetical protein
MEETEGLIECHFKETVSKETVLLLDSMVLGLQGIKEEYGRKYIRLSS